MDEKYLTDVIGTLEALAEEMWQERGEGTQVVRLAGLKLLDASRNLKARVRWMDAAKRRADAKAGKTQEAPKKRDPKPAKTATRKKRTKKG